jgi:hypothetical protein
MGYVPPKIINWPMQLKPKRVMWDLISRTKSGGVALNGMEQLVGTPDDQWQGSYDFVVSGVHEVQDKLRAWRYLRSVLSGRMNYIKIPTFDIWELVAADASSGVITHAGGTKFTNDCGYSGVAHIGAVYSNAGAGSRFVLCYDQPYVTPEVGTTITIAGFLHSIMGVAVLTGGRHRLEIRPGLRTGIRAGARVSYKPYVLGRLAGGQALQISMETVLTGSGKITIDEVIARDGIYI